MGRTLRIGFLALVAILILLESARALVGTLGHVTVTLGATGLQVATSTPGKGTPPGLSFSGGRPSQTPGATSTPTLAPTPTRTAGISLPEGYELAGTATEAVPPISTLYALATSDGRRVPWVDQFVIKRPARDPDKTPQPVQPSTPLPTQESSQVPEPTDEASAPSANAPTETQPPAEKPEVGPTEAPPAPTSAPVETQPPTPGPGGSPTEAPPPQPTDAPPEGSEGIPTEAPPAEGSGAVPTNAPLP